MVLATGVASVPTGTGGCAGWVDVARHGSRAWRSWDRNRSRFRRLHKRRYRCTRDAVLAAFGRRAILHQAAGRGQEIAVGVFRIDAGFHRRSAQLDVALLDGERLAGGRGSSARRDRCRSDPCPATNSTIPAEAYPTAWPRGELLNASMATVALGGQAAVTPIAGLVVDQQGEQCRGFGDASISPTLAIPPS